MKRARWRIINRFSDLWFALDPTCELLPETSPCVCGAFLTWDEALAHVKEIERARAVEAIQDGAQ